MIQPYHKMAWHLKAPRHKVDHLYTILKVMKKNMSINKLFGDKVLVIKNPGFNASLTDKMHLAGAVHFHTSFQMSVNHVALHGLVSPDKEMYLSREDVARSGEENGKEHPNGSSSAKMMMVAGKVIAQMASDEKLIKVWQSTGGNAQWHN
jgi:hypothetical protein